MARRARRSSSPASRGLSGVADAARARSPATVIQCSRPRMSRLVGLGGRGQRVGRQQPRAVAIAIESR
uniref:Uncharacterized protein n=1 Tax=Arundo donax TaxID=35708 RepID=A0A0A9BU63_ARUDO